jgi:hypothetical protein
VKLDSCERPKARGGRILDVFNRRTTQGRDVNARFHDGSQHVRCSRRRIVNPPAESADKETWLHSQWCAKLPDGSDRVAQRGLPRGQYGKHEACRSRGFSSKSSLFALASTMQRRVDDSGKEIRHHEPFLGRSSVSVCLLFVPAVGHPRSIAGGSCQWQRTFELCFHLSRCLACALTVCGRMADSPRYAL